MIERVVTVETQIPEDIYLSLQANGLFKEILAQQSRQLLAVRFYQDRTLSLGKAARLAALNRWDFMDLLAKNNVPVIDYSEDELLDEFQMVDKLAEEIGR